jgi:hypothetical protein
MMSISRRAPSLITAVMEKNTSKRIGLLQSTSRMMKNAENRLLARAAQNRRALVALTSSFATARKRFLRTLFQLPARAGSGAIFGTHPIFGSQL